MIGQIKEGEHIFDGFMHRPFNGDTDGWLNELPSEQDYLAVEVAQSVLGLFREVKSLRRENWELRQRLETEKQLVRLGIM